MKKVLAIVLCMIMIATCIPFSSFAEEVASGKCGTDLYWSFDDETNTLTFTGSGAMYDYGLFDSAPWYSYRTRITDIEFSDEMTSIGDYAFYNCTALFSVKIPDNIDNLGVSTFSQCYALENVKISDSVKEIRSFDFYHCDKLINVIVGKNVVSINQEAFNDCDSLKKIYLGESTEEIKSYAFSKCDSLETLIISKATTDFASLSLKMCDNLKYVYYLGTEEEFNKIDDNTSRLASTTRIFNEHEHVAGEWTVSKAPTCTARGTEILECSVCKALLDFELLAPAHTYTNYIFNDDASCISDGTETAKCDFCDNYNTRTAVDSKLGHNMIYFPEVEPTYSEPGSIAYYYCTRCEKCFFDEDGEYELDPASIDKPIKEWPFIDVNINDWFYPSVLYCLNNGYVNGIASNLFGPNNPLTREQFMQILFNISGENPADYQGATTYYDVPTGMWYSPAIKWAEVTGITHGMGRNYFGLGQRITREQFALLLMNYAQYLGYETVERDTLENFEDTILISPWARDAVEWAVAEQLIFGTTQTTLSPTKVATRAAATMILMHFDDFLARQNY